MNYETIWVFLTLVSGRAGLIAFLGWADGHFSNNEPRWWFICGFAAFIIFGCLAAGGAK
jgi:hypothetical protein